MSAVSELRARGGDMPIAALLEFCVAHAQHDDGRTEQRAAQLLEVFPSYRDAIDAFAKDPKDDAPFRMLVHVFHEAGMDEPWPGHSIFNSPVQTQN
jgi:hypothetical protein